MRLPSECVSLLPIHLSRAARVCSLAAVKLKSRDHQAEEDQASCTTPCETHANSAARVVKGCGEHRNRHKADEYETIGQTIERDGHSEENFKRPSGPGSGCSL